MRRTTLARNKHSLETSSDSSSLCCGLRGSIEAVIRGSRFIDRDAIDRTSGGRFVEYSCKGRTLF